MVHNKIVLPSDSVPKIVQEVPYVEALQGVGPWEIAIPRQRRCADTAIVGIRRIHAEGCCNDMVGQARQLTSFLETQSSRLTQNEEHHQEKSCRGKDAWHSLIDIHAFNRLEQKIRETL